MAKHDRRKRSSQPRSSRTVSIQVPLPVLGVLNGVREAFHGLCIKTGMQVLEAMMEGGSRRPVRPEGAPSGRAAGVARRERGQSSNAWRAPSCRAAAARSARRRRGAAAELPMGGGHRPAGRAHALGGRRRGVDAAVCGHVGPGAGRGGGAGNVEQRGVSGGSWRCQPSACGRFSAGRWASWTCGWSASTARSSGTIAWWWRWGSTRRAASTCWDCAKEPPRLRPSPAACSATW